MNNLTQSGKLIWISEPQTIGENKKVTFTVSFDAGNYEKKAAFDLWNDKVDLLKSFAIGDSLDVDFNIDSRSYKGKDGGVKVFTNLRAWRITPAEEKVEQEAPVQPQKSDNLPF